MSKREVNLQILAKSKSSRYFYELKRSPSIVAPHQLQQYYSILIRSINLNENTEEVFKALCKSLMANENNLDYFISNNCIDSFSVLEQPILNLIYILVSKSSKSITSKAVFIISKMIASFPREILHIIAIYTQKITEDLKQHNTLNDEDSNENNNGIDPWTVFDIALQNFNLFLNLYEDENTNYSIGVDYITLLGHIFEVSIDNNLLTQEKLDNIWLTCCSMLSSYDATVIIASYSLLNCIVDKVSSYSKSNPDSYKIYSFPLDEAINHLNQKKEFARYAISFMLRFPPPEVNDLLLNSLVKIASGDIDDDQNKKETVQDDNSKDKKIKNISTKSKFILMQIANDEHNCQKLLTNSKWMTLNGLPAFIDILTLFMICLSQKEYIDLFIEEMSKIDKENKIEIEQVNKDDEADKTKEASKNSPKENQNNILDNFTIFFNNILTKIPTDDIVQVICTVIKRIPLDERIVVRLSDSGFFTEFFNRSFESKNILNIQAGLIILHYVSKICYINDFDVILEKLVKLVGNGEKISTMAAKSCIELCKYEQCLESLKILNFADVLSQNPENHEFQQILKRFKKISKAPRTP